MGMQQSTPSKSLSDRSNSSTLNSIDSKAVLSEPTYSALLNEYYEYLNKVLVSNIKNNQS